MGLEEEGGGGGERKARGEMDTVEEERASIEEPDQKRGRDKKKSGHTKPTLLL